MEIHAPDHPILTLREALVHLAIVTIGILIALSFEGARQYFEHRSQIAEARANLLTEIRANKQALEKDFLARVPDSKKENVQMAALTDALLDHNKTALDWSSNYPIVWLQSAGFATAQSTGVFALMDYEEARRFTSVYRLQETFERQHELGLTNETTTVAIANIVTAAIKRNHPNLADITEWRHSVADLDTSLLVQSQIADRLDHAYTDILAEKH